MELSQGPSNGVSKKYIRRSERVNSQPDRLRHPARYATIRADQFEQPAQYADVSETGMFLISRKPAQVGVGEYLKINFSLPDQGETFSREARVVRIPNEFVFAVEFTDQDQPVAKTFSTKLKQYADFLKRPRLLDSVEKLFSFIRSNKWQITLGFTSIIIGIWISAEAISYSYSHQDPINSWGKIPHVKQFKLENIKRALKEPHG